MPAERSTKRKAGSAAHLSNDVEPCVICGKVVSRVSDIPRHMKGHDSDATKLPCPWEGCTFSTLQKSNLDTHYRRHTQDRSFLCTDDPACNFQTCDPASLLRHRKRLHGYKPCRKNNKPYKAPVRRGRKASIDSTSVASPFSGESSLGSTSSPASTSTSSPASTSTSSFSPPPSEESESDISFPSTPESIMNSSDSPLHPNESLLFSDSLSPCSYNNYAWDTSVMPELDFLTTGLETEQLDFQYSYPDQLEESQSQTKDLFLPLQLPNFVEQVFPGYETTGQLDGSYGLNFGLEQQLLQVPLLEMNTWLGLSVNGSPILEYHSLPAAESSQTPVEIFSPVNPVTTPVWDGLSNFMDQNVCAKDFLELPNFSNVLSSDWMYI